MDNKPEWEWEIKPNERWFKLNLAELIQYKDLLLRFVRRDIISAYQQTILGRIWICLQPLSTTFIYFIIFRKIVKVPTDGISPILFYMTGSIIWSYFSDCLLSTMNTFIHNSAIFSKVYFPRLIVPLGNIVFHTFRLSIQLIVFFLIYIFYTIVYHEGNPSLLILLIPFLILLTACFALGAGLIISVLTARYRDLDYILQFFLRLFMFVTPVVYPMSIVPEKYKFLFWLNPLTSVLETLRASLFAPHNIPINYLLLTILNVFIILFVGLVFFRKREVTIMDVI